VLLQSLFTFILQSLSQPELSNPANNEFGIIADSLWKFAEGFLESDFPGSQLSCCFKSFSDVVFLL
jgi:hypothetical protein